MKTPQLDRRTVLRLGLLGLGAGLVGACQVRPLYSAGQGVGPSEPLNDVAIEPVGSRVGQVVYNELNFASNGPANPRYRLALTVSSATTQVGVGTITGAPIARTVTVVVGFQLFETATNTLLIADTATEVASFDSTYQRFANSRAERDAEDRAARAAAINVRARVSAVLSART